MIFFWLFAVDLLFLERTVNRATPFYIMVENKRKVSEESWLDTSTPFLKKETGEGVSSLGGKIDG